MSIPKIAFSITMDQDVMDLLEDFCAKEKRSRSNAIEFMVLQYLTQRREAQESGDDR